MTNVTELKPDEETLTITNMDDDMLFMTVAQHLKSLTNALRDARGGIDLSGRDMANILEPVCLLMGAANKRRNG
jgi:hypothetical protein